MLFLFFCHFCFFKYPLFGFFYAWEKSFINNLVFWPTQHLLKKLRWRTRMLSRNIIKSMSHVLMTMKEEKTSAKTRKDKWMIWWFSFTIDEWSNLTRNAEEDESWDHLKFMTQNSLIDGTCLFKTISSLSDYFFLSSFYQYKMNKCRGIILRS